MKKSIIQKQFLNEERIKVLTKEYCEKYPNLNPDHIRFIINKITHLITNHFNPYNERWKQFQDANIIREVVSKEFSVAEIKSKTESYRSIYHLSNGNKNFIEYYFKGQESIKENSIDYQEMCKEITREQVDIITNTVLNSFSNAEKITFTRGDQENTTNYSFVDRVGGGSKKSVGFAASIINSKEKGTKKIIYK
jgi:hypothetical protein